MKNLQTFEEFLNESQINEATRTNFNPEVISANKMIDKKLFAKLMPKSAKTVKDAEERINSAAGSNVGLHVQSYTVKKSPDEPEYILLQHQYSLGTPDRVKVTHLYLREMVNGKLKELGQSYVSTDVFLTECMSDFNIIKKS